MPVALSYPQTAQSFQPAGRDSGTRHPQWSSRGYRGRSSAPDAAAWQFRRPHGAWQGCHGRGPRSRAAARG